MKQVDEDFWYEENIYSDIQQGTQVLIGTDGVWEVENNCLIYISKTFFGDPSEMLLTQQFFNYLLFY